MKLFIPACGDRLQLVKPWSFDLYLEHRNLRFAHSQGLWEPDPVKTPYGQWHMDVYAGPPVIHGSRLKTVRAELPAGSVIECDRVYIRTFNKSRVHLEDDYDSISWKLVRDGKAVKFGRFWVKLPDCYSIEYELSCDSLYRDRIKSVKEVLGS